MRMMYYSVNDINLIIDNLFLEKNKQTKKLAKGQIVVVEVRVSSTERRPF